jgi:methyl-accepting chemotaxis protein
MKKFIIGSLLVLAIFSASVSHVWSQLSEVKSYKMEGELPLVLGNLAQKIDARVATLKLLSKTIANDAHIHNWVNEGFDAEKEAVLVNKLGFLVKEYELTSASFADKKTHKYWNHEGFLRVLQPEVDTWYFAYLQSAEQDLISVYHDKNKQRVDLYVNYQQTDGNGLSGIATSFNGVLDLLNASIFARQGDIFLVDSSGKIQVHGNPTIAGNKYLKDIVGEATAKTLLNKEVTRFLPTNSLEKTLVGSSFMPNMGWFVVTEVPKKAILN